MARDQADPARRYTLKMKGEKGVYAIVGWESLTLNELAIALGDVTGLRADYLEREVLPQKLRHEAAFEIGEDFGGVPRWIIGSGAPQPARQRTTDAREKRQQVLEAVRAAGLTGEPCDAPGVEDCVLVRVGLLDKRLKPLEGKGHTLTPSGKATIVGPPR